MSSDCFVELQKLDGKEVFDESSLAVNANTVLLFVVLRFIQVSTTVDYNYFHSFCFFLDGPSEISSIADHKNYHVPSAASLMSCSNSTKIGSTLPQTSTDSEFSNVLLNVDQTPPHFTVNLDESPHTRWNHIIKIYGSKLKSCLQHVWDACEVCLHGKRNNMLLRLLDVFISDITFEFLNTGYKR